MTYYIHMLHTWRYNIYASEVFQRGARRSSLPLLLAASSDLFGLYTGTDAVASDTCASTYGAELFSTSIGPPRRGYAPSWPPSAEYVAWPY